MGEQPEDLKVKECVLDLSLLLSPQLLRGQKFLIYPMFLFLSLVLLCLLEVLAAVVAMLEQGRRAFVNLEVASILAPTALTVTDLDNNLLVIVLKWALELR